MIGLLPWALLLAGFFPALGQQVPNIGGVWRLTTTSFSGTIKIIQKGTALSGEFIFSGGPCAGTAPFTGSIATIFDLTANMSVAGGIGFSGQILSGGSYMVGQYGGGCVARGPFNFTASRASLIIPPALVGASSAASGKGGAISPGEIISIFGNPSIAPIGPAAGASLQLAQNGKVDTVLGNTRVHFSGIESYAPLIFASAGQVNAVVPYEVAGLASVSIQVEYLGTASDPLQLTIAATSPAFFTANGTGIGQAACLNHDGSVNSATHPEPRGGVLVLFLTGEGQTTPAGISGKVTVVATASPLTPAAIATPSVLINGQPAQVAFSGEAPGLVSGVMQLNVIVPTTISPGNVPIQLTMGGKTTPGIITVAVQ